jgi:hypothetical protein
MLYSFLLSNITYNVDGNGFSIPNLSKFLVISGIFSSKNQNASSLEEKFTSISLAVSLSLIAIILLYV